VDTRRADPGFGAIVVGSERKSTMKRRPTVALEDPKIRRGRASGLVRWLAMGVVVFLMVAVPAQGLQSDSAEALTMLERPSPGDRESTLAWFQFLLPRIVSNCSDIDSETSAATAVVRFLPTFAAEAGSHLGLTRVLERISDRLSASLARVGASFDCTEALVLYFSAVRRGHPSEEQAEEAVLVAYLQTWLALGHSHVRPLTDREHVESALKRSPR